MRLEDIPIHWFDSGLFIVEDILSLTCLFISLRRWNFYNSYLELFSLWSKGDEVLVNSACLGHVSEVLWLHRRIKLIQRWLVAAHQGELIRLVLRDPPMACWQSRWLSDLYGVCLLAQIRRRYSLFHFTLSRLLLFLFFFLQRLLTITRVEVHSESVSQRAKVPAGSLALCCGMYLLRWKIKYRWHASVELMKEVSSCLMMKIILSETSNLWFSFKDLSKRTFIIIWRASLRAGGIYCDIHVSKVFNISRTCHFYRWSV